MRHFITPISLRRLAALLALGVASAATFAPALADQAPATQPASQEVKRHHYHPYIPPPPNGAPGGVIGGAARGDSDLPMPELVVPLDHVVLTASAQPTLYFYVPGTTPNKVSVTLVDTDSHETVALPLLDGIKQKGLQRFDVSSIGYSLKPGVTYIWSVAIRATHGGPSHNAYAGAFIRYDLPAPEMSAALDGKDPDDKAAIFADNHFWFDTIAAQIDAINADPSDISLRNELLQTLQDNKCPVNVDNIPGPAK